jgi:predicted SAM-dependent methyltransferase
MPGISAIVFGAKSLDKNEIKGKRVIDVGCYDFNGSIRPLIESWEPEKYIGVDILEGPSVDIVCSAEELVSKFGKNSFDIVISTEMLEHAREWKQAMSNLKNICKPGGIMLITTRSYGYPYHGYPNDFWRYELEDIKNIFSDCEILTLESDYQVPGVFMKVRKPDNFIENDLSNYQIYSIVVNKRITEITQKDFETAYFCRLAIKEKFKSLKSTILLVSSQLISKVFQL